MNVLKDLESMFGILDVGRYVPNQGCHNMIKITRDEFSGTTTGCDTMGLPGLLRLWILGRKYMTGVRGVMAMRFLAV